MVRKPNRGVLEIRGSGVGGEPIFGRSDGLGKGEAWDAKQEEEFASPEQNIEQASALEIAQVLRLQADVEGLSRALLDESAHGGQVDGLGGELAAAGIKALKPLIATLQEVVQAESLVIQ
jgi:hypothetical protein